MAEKNGKVGLVERIKASEIWQSIFRYDHQDSPRGRAISGFHNFFLHIYPVRVPREVLRFRYSFRLGFIATVLFAILTATGILLMFYYSPSVPGAYFSIHEIQTRVAFGQFVRNLHRWSAHLMVVVAGLHMLRVFYRAAYKAPRQFNWVIGVFLLLITLALGYTGYLLPWDQLAYWAVQVGTNMASYTPFIGEPLRRFLLAGPEIGASTLLRFYTLHVVVLPAALTLLLAVHIWRVRKDGFAVGEAEAPEAGRAEMRVGG